MRVDFTTLWHLLRTRGIPARWVLLFGLLLTCALSHFTWREATQRDAERFANLVEQFRQEFETRVERYELGLFHLADWFVENELAAPSEWENRVERMNPKINFPGMVEVCYAPALNSWNIERWRGKAPVHWPPESEWVPWSFPVWYQANQPPIGSAPWGRFLGEELDRLRNWDYFAGARGFLCSGRVLIPTDSGPSLGAFVLVTGSYRKDLPPDGGEQGKEVAGWPINRGTQKVMAMLGAVTGTVCVEPLLESIFGGREMEIDCEIYAGPVSDTNRLNRLHQPPLAARPGGLFARLEIPWYYERWNIVAAPNELFHAHSHRGRAWVVGVAGGLLSVTLAGLMRTHERARASAEDWGRSLETAREELRLVHRRQLQLGRDLHDGALQGIYASVLNLRRAYRALGPNPEKASELIDGVIADLESTMEEVRRFLAQTRAEGLQPSELPRTVEGFVKAFNRLESSRIILTIDPSAAGLLNPVQAEQVLHVIREGVSNAHRHGQASTIFVELKPASSGVVIEIRDDGVGFDPQNASRGNGIQYMTERAALCGARFRIESRPGGPTLLHFEIPARNRNTRA